jgi:peptide chain release factor 1
MEESMRKRLEATKTRYGEIETELSQPDIAENVKKLTDLSKERASLQEANDKYLEYLKLEKEASDALELANSGDAEMSEKHHRRNPGRRRRRRSQHFRRRFAADVHQVCESQGWSIQYVDGEEGAAGGYSYVSFMVKGENVYSKLKFESGAHRVQRVPKTEAAGRIHTSTATVLVMPEAEEIDVKINPADLKIDTYR